MEDVHMEEAGTAARAEDGISGTFGPSSELSSHPIAPEPSSHPHLPSQDISVATSGDPNAIPHEHNRQSTQPPESLSDVDKDNQREDTRMDIDSSLPPEHVQGNSESQDGGQYQHQYQKQQHQQHYHGDNNRAATATAAAEGGLDAIAEPRSETVLSDGQPEFSAGRIAVIPEKGTSDSAGEHPIDISEESSSATAKPVQAGEAASTEEEAHTGISNEPASETKVAAEVSGATTTAQPTEFNESSSSKSARADTRTDTETKTEAGTGATSSGVESKAEDSLAPPARIFIPQFKFTTFSVPTQLPPRNTNSNFMKSDKNFVLKDLAARQRRRKRRVVAVVDGDGPVRSDAPVSAADATDGDADKDSQIDNGDQGMDKAEDKNEDGVSKKKRMDEFSAVRRGIFVDEENGDEGEDIDNKETQMGDRDDEEDEDEDDYSSESDSEESVVNEMDEDGESKTSADAGKKIIVIHPGSRILRIGRASDAYPVVTPHCIARRMRVSTTAIASKKSTSSSIQDSSTPGGLAASEEEQGGNDMDVDMELETLQDVKAHDVVNDRYLQEIEYDLKLRMKAAKRKPVANAKSQVRSFNASSRPEMILDHNDPYKVEWTDPAAEGDYIIGQKALNLPPGKHHTFKLFWPISGGQLNEKDYTTPRVVMSDLETIWTKVIQDDLGIDPKTFSKHYALLIIPDLYSKLYVIEMIGMLLKSMQFRGVMVQQESVCASFGAGVSAACVVDIGAETTKIACVEDGTCIPDSRAVLKYGGDDITRVFTALVKRTGFPYQELDLAQTYDWRLMEELKEKWCTMNEADLTVQVYSFFVRKPEKQTEKYQLKVYDEVALSPMCLFFPGVIRRWIEEREPSPNFGKPVNYEDINEDAPPIVSVNQSSKKNAAAAAVAAAAARAGTPSSMAPGEESNNNNGNVNGASNAGTPNATPAQTPGPSTLSTAPSVGSVLPPPAPVVIPFTMEPSVMTTDKSWEIAGTIGKDHFSSLVALDVVVAQSIHNCGSEEKSKKLYGSIILVGGGGMVQGFDRVLEDRLFQALPATLTTVEKVEVLPSPRDMDPRLLVWKGGSVVGKLEAAKELWIKSLEWEVFGSKVLRERALFSWSDD
ncbi:actin-like protein arp8 [Haplosporangium sp. Z 767]|nr:actin-like protein arp8 [Haplosporangium sp. Z 767]